MENRRNFNQSIITFDIETTSIFRYSDRPEWGNFRYESDDKLEDIAATMYVAMFCIEGEFVYFRTWEDVRKQLIEIREAARGEWCIVWIHNLAFEYQWLQNIVPDLEPFARSPRKPIFARSESLKIEFRCSYMLLCQSLENAAKSHNVPTLKGEMEYRLMRGKTTPLTDEELDYCRRDVVSLYEIIKQYRARYKKIEKIPFTSTSIIRRQVKSKCKRLYKLTGAHQPTDPKLFQQIMFCFSGGYTHANSAHTGEYVRNVHQWDLASAYPAAMLLETFPVSAMCPAPPAHFERIRDSGRVFFGRFIFTNIRAKGFNCYISASKCHNVETFPHFNVDNGRVHSAPFVDLSLTDIDYRIICENYTFDKCFCVELMDARRGRLDPEFLMFVLDLYKSKTELKGVAGREDEYRLTKTFINGLFGMAVTNTVRDEVTYTDGKWDVRKITIEEVGEKLEKIAKYRKAPLPFQAGVYIPAIVRGWLWSIIKELDIDNIYNDTDSIKHVKNHDDLFAAFNDEIMKKHQAAADYLGIDVAEFSPRDPKGKAHPIGVFEREPDAQIFSTLGAKRYAETVNGETWITVAGVRKQKLNNIHQFFNNRVFTETESGKSICAYIDEQPPVMFRDMYGNVQVCTERCAINLRPTSYDLSVDENYYRYYTTTQASILFGNEEEIESEEIWFGQ